MAGETQPRHIEGVGPMTGGVPRVDEPYQATVISQPIDREANWSPPDLIGGPMVSDLSEGPRKWYAEQQVEARAYKRRASVAAYIKDARMRGTRAK